MAKKYTLGINETVILKTENISYNSMLSSYNNDLILTNLNLILVKKNIMGKNKEIKYFQLSEIKQFNGRPQVLLGNPRGMGGNLDVYFKNSEESFGFQSKKKAKKWVETIIKLCSGEDFDTIITQINGDTTTFTDQLKEQFGVFGEMIKSKTANNSNSELSQKSIKVSKKCTGCGAPISGNSNKIIKCSYCDTDNHL